MIAEKRKLAAAKSPDAQTHLARDIAATDRAIDQLVYQLYQLTPGEIALVEQSATPAAPEEAPPMEEIPRPPPPSPTYAQAEADAAHTYFAKEDPPKSP